MKKTIQTIWLLLLVSNLSSQVIWIDSVYTQPLSPTINDTISIISQISASSSDCNLVVTDVQVDEVNNSIELHGCYELGIFTAICPSTDTFFVGQLEEGEYSITLKMHAFTNLPNVDCTDAKNETIHNSSIIVSGTNATTKTNDQPSIQLLNNPVHEQASFRIPQNEKGLSIKIINNLGVIVLKDQIKNGVIETTIAHLDVSHLPPGIYYCYFEHKTGESNTIKFIKQ